MLYAGSPRLPLSHGTTMTPAGGSLQVPSNVPAPTLLSSISRLSPPRSPQGAGTALRSSRIRVPVEVEVIASGDADHSASKPWAKLHPQTQAQMEQDLHSSVKSARQQTHRVRRGRRLEPPPSSAPMVCTPPREHSSCRVHIMPQTPPPLSRAQTTPKMLSCTGARKQKESVIVPVQVQGRVESIPGVEHLDPEKVFELLQCQACLLVDLRDEDRSSGLIPGAVQSPLLTRCLLQLRCQISFDDG